MNSLVNIVILATTYFRDQKTLATVLSPVFVNNVLSEHTYWNTHPFIYYLGGASGEGNGTPLQYLCLENPMNRGAWWATVHWVAKSQT